ncbi:MAG: hypothetical protein ACXVLQ_13795, partial [Bacteriovorax sp.]
IQLFAGCPHIDLGADIIFYIFNKFYKIPLRSSGKNGKILFRLTHLRPFFYWGLGQNSASLH